MCVQENFARKKKSGRKKNKPTTTLSSVKTVEGVVYATQNHSCQYFWESKQKADIVQNLAGFCELLEHFLLNKRSQFNKILPNILLIKFLSLGKLTILDIIAEKKYGYKIIT